MATGESSEVWLYDAGEWRRAPDPIPWQGGDVVHERYAEAGYAEAHTGLPFIDLVYPGGSPGTVGLYLWVRAEAPECIIDIEGPNETIRSVCVNRFPDALDLMARWAPLVTASKPIADESEARERAEAAARVRRQGGD